MVEEGPRLPALPAPGATCREVGYVSREEEAILAAMVALKREVRELRRRSSAGADLEAHLAARREAWHLLAAQREAAWRRKMILLGHHAADE